MHFSELQSHSFGRSGPFWPDTDGSDLWKNRILLWILSLEKLKGEIPWHCPFKHSEWIRIQLKYAYQDPAKNPDHSGFWFPKLQNRIIFIQVRLQVGFWCGSGSELTAKQVQNVEQINCVTWCHCYNLFMLNISSRRSCILPRLRLHQNDAALCGSGIATQILGFYF
jgi:hypothetical protein